MILFFLNSVPRVCFLLAFKCVYLDVNNQSSCTAYYFLPDLLPAFGSSHSNTWVSSRQRGSDEITLTSGGHDHTCMPFETKERLKLFCSCTYFSKFDSHKNLQWIAWNAVFAFLWSHVIFFFFFLLGIATNLLMPHCTDAAEQNLQSLISRELAEIGYCVKSVVFRQGGFLFY